MNPFLGFGILLIAGALVCALVEYLTNKRPRFFMVCLGVIFLAILLVVQ